MSNLECFFEQPCSKMISRFCKNDPLISDKKSGITSNVVLAMKFCFKMMHVSFAYLLLPREWSCMSTKYTYGLQFTQPHDSNMLSVLSPQPETQNIWILPSASEHQKYVGFVSLSLVSLKVSGLRFSQPHDSKCISVLFPSAS